MTKETNHPNQGKEDIIELKDIVEKGRYNVSQRDSSWTARDEQEGLELDLDKELNKLFVNPNDEHKADKELNTKKSFEDTDIDFDNLFLGKQDTQLSEIYSKIEILTAKVKQLEENQTKLLQSEDFESRIKEIFNKYIKDLNQWHNILNKIIGKEIEGVWSKIENMFYEFQEQIITRQELQNFASKIRKEIAEQISENVSKAAAQTIREEIAALMDDEQEE